MPKLRNYGEILKLNDVSRETIVRNYQNTRLAVIIYRLMKRYFIMFHVKHYKLSKKDLSSLLNTSGLSIIGACPHLSMK